MRYYVVLVYILALPCRIIIHMSVSTFTMYNWRCCIETLPTQLLVETLRVFVSPTQRRSCTKSKAFRSSPNVCRPSSPWSPARFASSQRKSGYLDAQQAFAVYLGSLRNKRQETLRVQYLNALYFPALRIFRRLDISCIEAKCCNLLNTHWTAFF